MTLAAEHLSVEYDGRRVLHGVNLAIAAGEWVAIVGPNGSGKSTLLRALAGLQTCSEGTVALDERELHGWDLGARARRIAYVPQALTHTPPFTIEELVLHGRSPHRGERWFASDHDRRVAHACMQRTDTLALRGRRLDQVSGGEAQRALIAAALAQAAGFVLLDEPTSALDLHHGVKLYESLRRERAERDLTIVLATHDLNLATRFCDRVVVLVDGRILADGVPDQVLRGGALATAYGPHTLLEAPGEAPPFILPPQAPGGSNPWSSPEDHAPPEQHAAASPLTAGSVAKHIALGAGLVAMAALVLPFFGSTTLSLSAALGDPQGGSPDATIFWQIRVPRVLLAMLAGACLAAAGAAFQALLRNPLATPYTLGVAGGASLGATMAVHLGLTFVVAGFTPVPIAAFVGALGSVFAVYLVARLLGRADSADLLLAGIAWSMVCSAFVLLVQVISDPLATARIVRWLVGGLDVVGYDAFLRTLPFALAGLLLLLWHCAALNQIAVDEALAASRGVRVGRVRLLVFIGASLATAAVVAEVGPIGFVGLIVPHAMRALVGADLRSLLPTSVLAGAVFLAVADTLARVSVQPGPLPVGVVTALLGGPFFVLVIVRGRRV